MMQYKKLLVSALLFLILLHLNTLSVLANDTDTKVDDLFSNSDVFTNQIQVLYNNKNGLPTSEANAVLQTQDGYVWFGGYGGLIRYDGYSFRNFNMEENNLKSSHIRVLYEDDKGRLIVGTNDGAYIYENNDFTLCNSEVDINYRSVRSLASSNDGVVFVGTSSGLAKIESDDRLVPIDIPELLHQTIESLTVDSNNVLWGVTDLGVLFALKDEELVYWFMTGDLSPHENLSVLSLENKIFVGTYSNFLIEIILIDDKYTANSYEIKLYDTNTISTINILYVTDDGHLWLGSNTGAAYFDSDMKFHFLPDFEYTFINSIAEDYEGGIWLASKRQGVINLTSGKFINGNRFAGLEGRAVNTVLNIDTITYIATDDGLVLLDDSWKQVHNELSEMLTGVRIRHLSADKNGSIWISTYTDYGLIRYTLATGAIKSFTEEDGLIVNKVRTTIELANGDIAIGTTNGINILRNDSIIETYGQEQGLEMPFILCLLETPEGILLAGSDGMGIYAIKDGVIENYREKDGLTAGIVFRMVYDEENNGIWISAGTTMFFANKNEIKEITDIDIGQGSVFDMFLIEDSILFLKNTGITFINRFDLLAGDRSGLQSFGIESGLSSNISGLSWSFYKNNMLYVCTVNGIFLLDVINIPKNSVPPKSAINEIIIENADGEITVFENPQSVLLPKDTKRITIRFASLSFGVTPSELEYFLEGFDVVPTKPLSGDGYSVNYTNLSGGDYTFTLNVTNADGIAGESPTIVHIEKELNLWEYGFFWIIIIVIVLILTILIIKFVTEIRIKKHDEHQLKYKEITDQALKTIANTIDAKDNYTKGHSQRVAEYSVLIAAELGLTKNEQENIYYVALLHDIGKIGIPDYILHKTGALTDEEMAIMRSHPQIGYDILKDFTALELIEVGAFSHHENYDGSGYPMRQVADDIPMIAQIIHVADAYDAMASYRSYRSAQDKDYIISEFETYCGTQFNPIISKIMIKMIKEM